MELKKKGCIGIAVIKKDEEQTTARNSPWRFKEPNTNMLLFPHASTYLMLLALMSGDEKRQL